MEFDIHTDNNIKSYTQGYGDFVVFADLRSHGRIDVSVYKKPLPKRKSRAGRVKGYAGSFHILDSWKNSLGDKYEKRLKKITRDD